MMSRSSGISSHLPALPLLVPALGLALFLRAAAAPSDLLNHVPFYVGCMAGAWACFAAGVFWIRRYPSVTSGALGMAIILGASLIVRGWLLPVRPTLSTDIYRYLWDGHVIISGRNPYALPPTAPELAALRNPDWRHINFPEVRTPYPPVSEALFGLAAVIKPDSVLVIKLVLGVCELLTLWLIATFLRRLKRPRSDLLLYAWSPLVIAETWLHGHNDCLGVALLLASLLPVITRREPPQNSPTDPDAKRGLSDWIMGGWLGLAVMGKQHALLAIPLLLPRMGWRGLLMTLVVVTACVAPFLIAGPHLMEGAQSMAKDWSVNGSLYPLLNFGFQFARLSARYTRVLCVALLILGLILLMRRPSDPSAGTFPVYRRLGYAYLLGYLLSPVLQPWYLLWLAPFACLTRTASFLVFTSVVTLWYLEGAAPALSYVPVYVCLAVEVGQAWRNRRAVATPMPSTETGAPVE